MYVPWYTLTPQIQLGSKSRFFKALLALPALSPDLRVKLACGNYSRLWLVELMEVVMGKLWWQCDDQRVRRCPAGRSPTRTGPVFISKKCGVL